MTDIIEIDAGELLLNEEDRTATGLLIPFGEQARSTIGLFSADESSFAIPADVTGLGVNVQHERGHVVGGIQKIWNTPGGTMVTLKYAKTPEGDAAMQAARDGKRSKLSAELTGVIIQAGKAVAGRIFGASLVERGAFAGATLLLAEDTSIPTSGPRATDAIIAAYRALDAAAQEELQRIWAQDSESAPAETVTETAPASSDTPTPASPAEKEEDVPEAIVPETLLAGAAATDTPKADKSDGMGLTVLLSLIGAARKGDRSAKDKIESAGGEDLFLALNDIKYDGTGGLNNVQLPQFVGEVWQARKRGRNVIPQFAMKQLTDTVLKGWAWGTRPEVSTWAGNKANVPTTTATVDEVDGAIQRFAGGNDIAREFYDFGKTDVIAAYLAALADSYADKSDAWFLAQLLAAAGAGTAVAVPVGTPAGLGKVVQGALQLVTAGAKPSVAFVAPDVFSSIVYTKKDDTLEYLNAAVGTDLTDGSTQGFSIIPRAEMTAGTVLVADRNAANPYELPGSPIRVNALDMVKGGVDEAVFGYIGALINDAAGLALIKNAA